MALEGIAPVIDADGHIFDWHIDWAARAPSHLRDAAPRSITGDQGRRQIEFEGKRYPVVARKQVLKTTRPPQYWKADRAGQTDPVRRMPDMDEMGIDVAVLFGGHAMLVAAFAESPATAVAGLHAHNDWLAEYCATDPKRLKGAAMVPMQAPEEGAQELRAMVKAGMVAAVLPPHHANGMMLSDKRLAPIYAEAQDLDVPIGIHTIGIQISPARSLLEDLVLEDTYGCFPSMLSVGTLMLGGVLDQFPSLTFAVLEAGVGWVPFIAERLEHNAEFFTAVGHSLKRKPLDYLAEGRFYVAADPDEPMLAAIADFVGEDHIVCGSDYCHPEGMSPYTMRALYERPDLSPALKRKILSDNPKVLYRL